MTDPANILVVEDDKSTRVVLTALLEESMYRVRACRTAEEALNHLMAGEPLDIVVSDLRLPDGSGLQILWTLKKINPDAAFILITGHASLETAIAAVNEGAFAYHVKPLDIEALNSSIRNALRHQLLSIQHRSLLETVQNYNVELANKNLELERASQGKSQILSTVSHELKTPLTSILGHVDRILLQEESMGRLSCRQRKYLQAVHEDSLRLKLLIDDLLDVSRIDSGSLDLNLAEVDIRQVIEESLASTRHLVSEAGLETRLELSQELSWVTGDRLRLVQLLANLIGNSCKYTPSGGTITVAARVAGHYLRIDVSDTGVGISPEDQTRLFTKFFRVDNALTRRTPGSGLGLFIARHLAEAHGGTIGIESDPGKGSTFSISLPTVDALGPPPLPANGQHSDQSASRSS